MEFIKERLEIIPSAAIRRRLEREFNNILALELIYPHSVSVNIKKNNSVYNETYSVEFMNMKDNKYYEFIISNNYPFNPPKLNINFKPYSYYLNFQSFDFKKKIENYKKIRCFCCSTKICGDNWSPAYTMRHILDEVVDFRKICRDISYLIIIDVIKRKYLIEDINIIQWLL